MTLDIPGESLDDAVVVVTRILKKYISKKIDLQEIGLLVENRPLETKPK